MAKETQKRKNVVYINTYDMEEDYITDHLRNNADIHLFDILNSHEFEHYVDDLIESGTTTLENIFNALFEDTGEEYHYDFCDNDYDENGYGLTRKLLDYFDEIAYVMVIEEENEITTTYIENHEVDVLANIANAALEFSKEKHYDNDDEVEDTPACEDDDDEEVDDVPACEDDNEETSELTLDPIKAPMFSQL